MKYLMCIMLMWFAMTAKAQVTPDNTNLLNMQATVRNAAGTPVSADTTASGSADTTYLSWTIGGACDQIVAATFTKTGGTVGGSALLQGSLTGVWAGQWFTLKSDITGIAAGQTVDTATLANATGTYYWVHPKHKFKYYRVRFITSGGAAAPTGIIYYRRNN